MTRNPNLLLALLVLAAVAVVGQLYVMIPLTGAIAGQFDVASAAAVWSGTAFGLAYAAGFLV